MGGAESDVPSAAEVKARVVSRIPANDAPPAALRARKLRRAREHAVKVASEMFRRHGYDETSLEDIATEAEMSASSLVRYFGSKERLALAHHIDHLEAFRAHLADEGTPVLERWRNFIVDQASSLRSFSSYTEERQLIVSVPSLLRLLSRIQLDQQDELTAAFSREAGLDPEEDLYGRLLAALLVAGNEAVYIQWLRTKGKRDLAEMCLAVVDFAATRLGSRDETVPDLVSMSPGSPVGDADDGA